MRFKPLHEMGDEERLHKFQCPGCSAFAGKRRFHCIPTAGPKAWQFNGDVARPTLSPSILVYESVRLDDGTVYQPRCHSFVRDGRIEFLGDCGHALAGQTVDLPEVDA